MTDQSESAAQINRILTRRAGRPSQTLDPPFDPESGVTVFSPQGEGSGWWVGAPSVFWDGTGYYLAFRTRRPQPERGGLFQIARSDNGESFEVIALIRKEELGTSSIERGALIKTDDGRWRLYLSYVDPADDRWRIDLIEANRPEELSAEKRVAILDAAAIGAEGVKDPWVCRFDGTWHMIVSYAPTPEGEISRVEMHGTRDIYNTGTSKSLTGLATSDDGIAWNWHGSIFEPQETGWDQYAARINTVYVDGNQFVGLYDGSKSVAENYEERCGGATSTDLRTWVRVSTEGPIVGPNGGPGSVRYAEAVQADAWIRFYYEFTRVDGSHELRTVLVSR
jgi:hypothetical protein